MNCKSQAETEAAVSARVAGEEFMRDLQENSGAVARLGVRARGAAVLEVREGGQRPPDGLVARLRVEPRDERDPAGVVLVGRVVEALAVQDLVIAPSPDGVLEGAR